MCILCIIFYIIHILTFTNNIPIRCQRHEFRLFNSARIPRFKNNAGNGFYEYDST